jgi:hypothetical protein
MFRKATKSQSRLRLALVGPSGSGKTFSALAIAAGLGGRIAVIDTEHGSASKYASDFDFDTVHLASYDPRVYIETIKAAEAEGYDILVIDSLSHAWTGKGGALELVDSEAKKTKSNNTFAAWRNVTPIHNALVEAMIQSRCHIIATMRSKVDYVLEPDSSTGKLTPKKVGMAPIQREGMDYEFDVVGDLTLDHDFIISKTRCRALDGQVINKPGGQLAATLKAWLTDGATAAGAPAAEVRQSAPPPRPTQQAAAPAQSVQSVQPVGLVSADVAGRLLEVRSQLGMSDQQWISALSRRGVSEVSQLSANDAESLLNTLMAHVMKKQADERAAQDGAAGGKDQYPFEAAAKPEDVAAHQAELPSQAVPDQTSDRRNEQPKDQAAAGSATETPAAESSSAEDFTLPDVPRPEKPEKPGRKSSKTKASTTATDSKEPATAEAS